MEKSFPEIIKEAIETAAAQGQSGQTIEAAVIQQVGFMIGEEVDQATKDNIRKMVAEVLRNKASTN